MLTLNFAEADKGEAAGQPQFPELVALLKARAKNMLRFRTYLVSANEFKGRVVERGACPSLVTAYRSLRLSEWVAVVEFVDIEGPLSAHQCLGEAVFDATSNPKNPGYTPYGSVPQYPSCIAMESTRLLEQPLLRSTQLPGLTSPWTAGY